MPDFTKASGPSGAPLMGRNTPVRPAASSPANRGPRATKDGMYYRKSGRSPARTPANRVPGGRSR